MGNFFDTCKEIVEACKEIDTTEYREYQQQKKIHKYQKKAAKRNKRKVAALTATHYTLKKINDFIDEK